MPPQPCKSCGAPILFVLLPSGSTMPVDLEPRADGRIVLDADGRSGQVLSDAQIADLPAGTVRHISHYATCPSGARHRKPKAAGKGG